MSVLPPSFEELVDESARIVRGKVTGVESFVARTPDGTSVIKTRVTWSVSRVLKGGAATEYSLEFLGGSIGERHMVVPGMPTFRRGDEDYLFVEYNEKTFCPLLAAGHGRYRVQAHAAAQRTFIARDNHQALSTTSEVSEPLEPVSEPTATSPGMSPDEFEARVLARIQHMEAVHATR